MFEGPGYPLAPMWGKRIPPYLLDQFEQEESVRRFTNNPWVLLGLLVAAGVGLLVIGAVVDLGDVLHELSLALGGALVIAGVLGASVDVWLKERLLQDAFRAVFGYMLPEELRDELGWIYQQEEVCSRLDVNLTLVPTDDPGLVVLEIRIRQTIRNVSGKRLTYVPSFTVDEWRHPDRPSSVTELGFQYDGHRCEAFKTKSEEHALSARTTEDLALRPGDEFTMWAAGIEVRRISDEWFFGFSTATVQPRFTLRGPGSFKTVWELGARGEPREFGPGTLEIPGTVLPLRALRLRWWQEGAADDT